MAQCQLAQLVQFFVGIVNIMYAVYEPRIAIAIGIADGYGLSSLQRQDEVFRIEHVEHRVNAVAIDLRHVTSRITNGTEEAIHFRSNIGIDKLLITA